MDIDPVRASVRRSATEDLDAGARAAIIDVCIAAHDEQDFKRLFSYIPSGGRHFMAYRGEALVSHAVVTTRWLHLDGQRLRTAYVDAVATLPECQGQGYASAVMRLLAESVDDYDIGCLETERPTFYERLGWERWRGPLAGLRNRERIPTPEETGVMILRLPRTAELDLDSDLTIESDGNRIW